MPNKPLRQKVRVSRVGILIPILLLFIILASGQTVLAAPRSQTGKLLKGDVLVSLGLGQVQWYDANGKFLGTLTSKFDSRTGGLAINPEGKYLYVTSLDQNNISLFDLSGEFLDGFGSGYDGGLASILFDREGNMHAGQYSAEENILKFDAGGNLIDKHNIFPLSTPSPSILRSAAPIWIDLASDQSTIFFTLGTREIYRYDISSTGTVPGIFVTLPPVSDSSKTPFYAAAFRLLPPGDGSGGLLLADYGEIKRLDGFGNVVFTYDAPEEDQWLAMSLDPDGKSFWSASATHIYKFDIESGEQLLSFNAGNDAKSLGQTDRIWAVMVVGEFTAALPTPTYTLTVTDTSTPTFIPSLTPTGTLTVVPTDTPTNTPENTLTPTGTQAPPPPVITALPPVREPSPLGPVIILVGVILGALAIGTVALVARGARIRPSSSDNLKPRPMRARVQGHPDAGEQTVIPSSDLPTPQIRLKVDQGSSDFHIETQETGNGD